MLTRALVPHVEVSVILMRKLLPRFLYPGKERVGKTLTTLSSADYAPTFDGVDWYLVPSILKATRFLLHHRPDIIILQWWTGAVLVPYSWLGFLVRKRGGRVIVEFHEDQDTGEAAFRSAARIGQWGVRRLISSATALVVHSEWDRERLSRLFGLDGQLFRVIPHGPYPMVVDPSRLAADVEMVPRPERTLDNAVVSPDKIERAGQASVRGGNLGPLAEQSNDDETVVTVLFFGTIRPYKGLEDLVTAFELLPRDAKSVWRLLVVGETWEGWHLPIENIKNSRHRGDIELVNRYVSDAEVATYFARADIVALPYLRSSASGPLHLAMSAGLPVVITRVGGLVEAAQDYSGTVFASPHDPEALARAIAEATRLTGIRHAEKQTWDEVAKSYGALFEKILPSSQMR